MIITVSILAGLIFILASLFAVLMFQFKNKAKKTINTQEKEEVAVEVSSNIEKEDQLIADNSEQFVKDEINHEQQSEHKVETSNNFKPLRATNEVQSNKSERLRSANVSALAGDDVLATKLDLARVYLDIDSIGDAKKLLRDVLAKGNESQRDAANALLKQFEITI
ncbi:MAG: hypothetical protein CMF39_02945 [Legionellaceae bacterium]|nr:hypothetical protein [Legionellaceae bacterium]